MKRRDLLKMLVAAVAWPFGWGKPRERLVREWSERITPLRSVTIGAEELTLVRRDGTQFHCRQIRQVRTSEGEAWRCSNDPDRPVTVGAPAGDPRQEWWAEVDEIILPPEMRGEL